MEQTLKPEDRKPTDCYANDFDFFPLYRLPNFDSPDDKSLVNTRGDGKQYPLTQPSEEYFEESEYVNVSKRLQRFLIFYLLLCCFNIVIIILTLSCSCRSQQTQKWINLIESSLSFVYWGAMYWCIWFINEFSTQVCLCTLKNSYYDIFEFKT